jgi:hypothetical protein
MMGPVTSRTLRRLLTIVLACLFGSGVIVRAQSPGDQPPAQIGITAEVFGLGGLIREGEWAGVRLVLNDLGDRPRAVAVRLHLPDPDGDTALMQRTVTLNPGLAQGLWIYGLMPWGLDRTAFTVTVHEFDVNSAGENLDDGVGAQLAAERIAPLAPLAAIRPVIAVLGRSPAGGLGLYETNGPQGQDAPSTSHELPRLLVDLTPESIPDRWMGLAMVESLFWFAGEPSALSESQAQALREWVYRGGHLIVSVPSAGQSWTNPRANPIQDMLPAVELRRIDGVDLTTHAMLLQPRGGVPLPANTTIHELHPAPDALPGEADVILAAPDGAPMVVRRALGAGLVTLVGYDMNDQRLGARVDTQYFWHRVLGKRFDALTRDKIRELAQSGQANFSFYDPSRLDTDIGPEIAKQGRAGAGVLLGLGVFALYLVIAGPGGFGLLKLKRVTQHAWVAFVACIAVFAAIAWGGAAALRPTRAEVQHLTFFDHVFGQQEQHARIWFSALLPEYGDALMALGTDEDRRAWTQALAAWADASSTGGRPFPDTRGYVVDARDPSQFVVPTRSTVKQFRGDWLGRATIGAPVPVGGPLSVRDESGGTRLRGVVRHSLPAALEDVTILVVRGQKPLRGDLGPIGAGPLFGRISAARLTDDWAPDAPIDFEQIPANAWDTGERYFERLVDSLSRGVNAFGGAAAVPDRRDAATRLEAISWHASLKPPAFTSSSGNQQRLLQRWESHGLDLSAWLTQPCVIIVGHLNGSPSPAPVFINGREAPSSGRTVVRWVYPLPSEPPTVPETNAPPDAVE